jgi:hypothetical protein
MSFNARGVWAIYRFELARFGRTIWTSLVTPAITTSLYFIVFGAAIGSRMTEIGGVPYGAFIVPGLMLLSMLTESISNASFGIYMPKWSGTIYELLSAPLSAFETVVAYVGAAATKSVIIALVILATAHLFIDIDIAHPVWMVGFLLPVRLRDRHLGEELRAAPGDPAASRDAAHFPRRRLLLARHAARTMAHPHAFQPCRLSYQRLPLELLRHVGCVGRPQPWHDARLPRAVPRARLADLPHRLQAQGLTFIRRGVGGV